MKNLLRFVLGLSLATILFSSCTKDSLKKPEIISKNSKNQITPNDPGPIANTGYIQAMLLSSSSTSLSLEVYNDTGFRVETFADENGNVFIGDIPEGTYSVIAHAYEQPSDRLHSGSGDITIMYSNIQVVTDQITDMGKIVFE